jgi:osmotically-inducible protein OsmY
VRAALRAHEATSEVDITIAGSGSTVVLQGIVLHASERDAAAEVTAAVPGVGSVDNQLRVMATSRLFTSSKV